MSSDNDSGCDMTIAELPKSATEDVRIQLRRYFGKSYVSLRVWWTRDDGTQVATRKGVTLPLDMLPGILGALQAAEREAINAGMLPDGNASERFPESVTSESVTSRTCAMCGAPMDAKRKHARYCSSACRVRGSRARQIEDAAR